MHSCPEGDCDFNMKNVCKICDKNCSSDNEMTSKKKGIECKVSLLEVCHRRRTERFLFLKGNGKVMKFPPPSDTKQTQYWLEIFSLSNKYKNHNKYIDKRHFISTLDMSIREEFICSPETFLRDHKWPAPPHNINSESCSLVRTIYVSDYSSIHFPTAKVLN